MARIGGSGGEFQRRWPFLACLVFALWQLPLERATARRAAEYAAFRSVDRIVYPLS